MTVSRLTRKKVSRPDIIARLELDREVVKIVLGEITPGGKACWENGCRNVVTSNCFS